MDRIFWKGEGTCAATPYAFDTLLRALWSVVLPRLEGGLFHACGLRYGGAGVLFPGVSGMGKSTLARKIVAPEHVLSDELVPARRVEKGAWRIYASPFRGEYQQGAGSLRSWPLACLAFLRPDDRLTVSPLSKPEATRRILETILCFETDDEVVRRNLELSTRLCSEVPCVELHSALDTPAIEIFKSLEPWIGDIARYPDEPLNNRERISELRALLQREKAYAFAARGGSMTPSMKAGDIFFIDSTGEEGISAGDILVYWRPGPRPEDDTLIGHRMVGKETTERGTCFLTKGDSVSRVDRFVNGRDAEILGKVVAVSRNGETRPVSRLGGKARLAASLAAMPLQRLLGR